MALRLIEIYFPQNHGEGVEAVRERAHVLEAWRETMADGQVHLSVLVDSANSELFLDAIEHEFGGVEGFRAMIIPVEAVVPRPPSKPAEDPTDEATGVAAALMKKGAPRVSREVLYARVSDGLETTGVFFFFVLLSTVLAAIGLLRNNVAVVIGAMVVAPLLGPNVALGLATTLADKELALRALKVSALGLGSAFVMALFLGVFQPSGLDSGEIMSRTTPSISDIALALASGCAGALALTSAMGSALIGVMVAVALLPPLVTCGLLLGAQRPDLAIGALQLLLVNLVCVNLASVTTFLVLGIGPRTWWEAGRARRATRWAMGVWIVMLAGLALLLALSAG